MFSPDTKEQLNSAINLWCYNKQEAIKRYGNISEWDTSKINDMQK
jgi:hypothetical protein